MSDSKLSQLVLSAVDKRKVKGKVKVAVIQARQQLGSKKRDKQAAELGLLAHDYEQSEVMIDHSGLSLTESERRLTSAILNLMESTGEVESGEYKGQIKGHGEAVWTDSNADFSPAGSGVREVEIYASETDLLELMGEERGKNGRFQTKQRKKLRDSLNRLSQQRFVLIYEAWFKGKKHAVKSTEPLFNYAKQEYFDNLKSLLGSADPRGTYYKIRPHHIVTANRNSFYYLESMHLNAELIEARSELGYKQPRAIPHDRLLLDYLQTLNAPPKNGISREALAEKLRLDTELKQRRSSRIERTIEQAFETAKHLGFIKSWQMVELSRGKVKYRFKLNPERCSRYAAALEKGRKLKAKNKEATDDKK